MTEAALEVMAPRKIMIIRHAEKALPGTPGIGVDEQGAGNRQSLTVKGWVRAGALARVFAEPSADGIERPDVIYATGTRPDSPSRRSLQTAAPAAAKLGCRFITKFGKSDIEPAIEDALRQDGVVLMVWEHKMLPRLIRALPHAPVAPARWPPERFDLIWVLHRSGEGWLFNVLPQHLLEGDGPAPAN